MNGLFSFSAFFFWWRSIFGLSCFGFFALFISTDYGKINAAVSARRTATTAGGAGIVVIAGNRTIGTGVVIIIIGGNRAIIVIVCSAESFLLDAEKKALDVRHGLFHGNSEFFSGDSGAESNILHDAFRREYLMYVHYIL